MKLKWLFGMLLTAAITIPSVAQVSLYIGRTPPPERYERRTEAPGPGYTWIDGYWTPNGRRYRWVEGHWQQPPYEGAYWSHPHYDHYQQGWQLHEGHWDRENHDNGHWNDQRNNDQGHNDHGDNHHDDHGNDQHNR